MIYLLVVFYLILLGVLIVLMVGRDFKESEVLKELKVLENVFELSLEFNSKRLSVEEYKRKLDRELKKLDININFSEEISNDTNSLEIFERILNMVRKKYEEKGISFATAIFNSYKFGNKSISE